MNKTCKHCQEEKPIVEFPEYKPGKYRGVCNSCYKEMYFSKEIRNKYMKKYRKNNRESICERRRELYSINPEKYIESVRKYQKENEKECKDRNKKYKNRRDVKDKVNERYNKRWKEDNLFKLRCVMRFHIYRYLKGNKNKRTMDIVGLSTIEFKKYLESKFDKNMSWDNYGDYWVIDHVTPLVSAQCNDDVYRLNHYTNLRPFPKIDNLKKSDKEEVFTSEGLFLV